MVLDQKIKGVLYYTDNKLEGTVIDKLVRKSILKAGLPITSVSLQPTDFGKNIHMKGLRSHSTLYKQILIGLKASTADYIFFCEHDVLYHPSHFDFIPERDDRYYYNNNVYKYRLSDRKIVGYDCNWLSQLCANRELLIKHYEKRLKMISEGKRAYGYEPGTGQSKSIDMIKVEKFESEYPNIDIRHGGNWTGVDRMNPKEFKNKSTCQNFREINIEDITGWDIKMLKEI